ncbi:magnesium transporter [Anaerosporobacter mobilis DSM 15930]|jgi:magnesium transporter|uniref:Magnesium transporter n=1 Tax=Anaerosporobacter mobilis DSM 15930 TaxID=1120996 RepID=A0A1M7F174_9FIRM|nr:CorA family divalent cation transporter [Anaerosporobacter mobilis]SHL97834.1 magnesium transporter [Anaerosporobacter mobilis DSM 15930]
MYFRVDNEQVVPVDKNTFLEERNVVAVFNHKQWKEEKKLQNKYQLTQSIENVHFCKVERHIGYLFGTCYVPIPKEHMSHKEFVFYIIEGKIIFIDDSNTIVDEINRIAQEKIRRKYSLERLLYDVLINLIENDLLFLELIEQEISKIEEYVLKGTLDNFNTKMLEIKKMIAKLYRYYSQMTDLGEEILDNEEEFFEKEGYATFRVFTDRASRLQNETQTLREYAMQVQDVYQSEIGIRQNNVMKVLTIVTTIFLPLTLIVGWYGMNFVYMPEISWRFGYPMVILISALIVIGSLLLFKKKKYW